MSDDQIGNASLDCLHGFLHFADHAIEAIELDAQRAYDDSQLEGRACEFEISAMCLQAYKVRDEIDSRQVNFLLHTTRILNADVLEEL
jgi:hypothetical protein